MYFYSKESSRIEDNYKTYSHLGYKGICAFCGDSFESSSPKAKYCSKRCQNDAYMKRRKERKALEKQKVCVICKKQFTAKKKDAMYCCKACKQKAYREKKNVTNLSSANFG
mgnify:FL=1